jgi:hypothetical protein
MAVGRTLEVVAVGGNTVKLVGPPGIGEKPCWPKDCRRSCRISRYPKHSKSQKFDEVSRAQNGVEGQDGYTPR